jgi:predicted Zn-dependent peptidase
VIEVELPALRVETDPRRHLLDEGTVLLSRPLPEVYGVALAILVQTGTRDEPEKLGGISHLLEHMVFKGTRRRTAFELARDMEAIGGQLDAYTTKEHTAYTLKVLPSELEVAVDILADMLLESTFPQDQLELEQQVVVEEILSAEDSPEDYVHERFAEHLWPAHPLRRPILGTEGSVRSLGRPVLQTWSSQVHRSGNVILAASGAIGLREEEILSRAFRFPAGEKDPSPKTVSPLAPGVWNYPRASLSQQYVEIGIPALDSSHADRYALALLANLLGGGMSSRLFQKVREESGLAYSIYSYADYFRDSGMLATSFSSSPENCQRALDVIVSEYERLRRGDVDDDEIRLNKAQLVSSVILGLEGTLGQALRVGRSEMLYGRFVPVGEILEQVDRIQREDIVRLAESYLDPASQTVVSYGPLQNLNWIAR